MHWTKERTELLKELWSEGLSAKQIAEQLGGVSRNGVIGKARRLQLSAREPGWPRTVPDREEKTESAKTSSPASVPVEKSGSAVLRFPGTAGVADRPAVKRGVRPDKETEVPTSRRLSLMELTERTCKWPGGDFFSPDFGFCGNEAGQDGPYCPYHARIAYQPLGERRRA